MKKYLGIAFTSFLIVGCGGGGGSTATTDDTNITIDETVTLKISSKILKISYLPSSGIANAEYTLLTGAQEGNATLLDSTEGRFSYVNSGENNDTFLYKVTGSDGSSKNIEVKLTNMQLPVMTNDGTIEDFNSSSPDIMEGKELANFSSNLPVMIIDIGDREIPDDPKVMGTLTLFEPGSDSRTYITSTPTHVGFMEIERRGSSSQLVYPKKQYGMDTILADGDDDDISLLGMPEEHKWILQAPYADKTLMRNYLVYHKAREVDESKYYAVRSEFVEVLTRVGDQYRYDGLYVLMEKIKRGSDRLDISKLQEEDINLPEITGGYILKQDWEPDPDEFGFSSTLGTTITVNYPGLEDLTADQQYYIENHIQSFEKALKASDFNDSTSDNYYGKWIDEESFIVHFLVRELFLDVDTWIASEFFHKDREKNLAMTPVWDFNSAMGNNNFRLEGRNNIWAYEFLVSSAADEDYSGFSLRYWMERLMSDPAFKAKVRTKWQALRVGIWSDANLSAFIATSEATLTEAAARNFERWPNVLGKYVWPNKKLCNYNGQDAYCATFDDAINLGMKTWLLGRTAWIDNQLQ